MNKKGQSILKDLLVIIIGGLILSGIVIGLLWWALERQGSKCDEAMGYTCSIYEIDNYNWERK